MMRPRSPRQLPMHLERTALVYVRQSTPGQVRGHVESQRRQYALADVARELGFCRVETIDDDLGISGSGFAERPGFQRLLTTVCSGTAGAVLALEASRLARNDRDWSQLVELGAITKIVLIDQDGISGECHQRPERVDRTTDCPRDARGRAGSG